MAAVSKHSTLVFRSAWMTALILFVLFLSAGFLSGQTFPVPSPRSSSAAIGNLLFNKPASQSSTYPGSPAASVVVDGITDGSYSHGSVTATNAEASPWWQVDMQGSMQIGTVVIWNRTDCCGSRLQDYWVFLSDTPFLATDTPGTLGLRQQTIAIHQTAAPGASTAIPVNNSGRYLRVQLSGTEILSLAEVQAFVSDGATANAALNKAASQSSTMGGTPSASAAVDGNTSGNFYDGSVTATNPESTPWWQVDLGASTAITTINVWNRTDCCGSRMGDYWVFVSDSPFAAGETPGTLQSRAGTSAFHQNGAPSPSTSIAVNAQGRYVRVQLPGTDVLSLAEVQVLTGTANTDLPNLALGTNATESSRMPGTPGPEAAIDTNTDGVFYHGSVTATNLEASPWWQLDLQGTQNIGTVKVWNRTDCCSNRLADFWVFVSNTDFQASDTPSKLQSRAGTFAYHQVTSGDVPQSITVPIGTQGRYVRIQLSGTDYLSLAEVQVFPPSNATGGSNAAGGKTATQSSTMTGTPSAAVAVDGNTNGSFYGGSVTATNQEFAPWWQVDLGTSTAIDSVSVWNRTDCCGSRLGDYWLFVSDTAFGANDTPAVLQSRAGTLAFHQTSAPNPSASIAVGGNGRYVRVQLPGDGLLSLAEVQAFTGGGAVTTLSNGQAVSGTLSLKQQASYRITVPGGMSQLQFTTTGSGDNDIYVKYGSQASVGNFDCRSTSPTANEVCTFNVPPAGDWYVVVLGYGTANYTLTAKYQ